MPFFPPALTQLSQVGEKLLVVQDVAGEALAPGVTRRHTSNMNCMVNEWCQGGDVVDLLVYHDQGMCALQL